MRQNVYDDPQFFDGYKRLRNDDSGLNGAVEEPAVATLLPDISGKAVLDLGCGFGHFCRAARAQGASRVVGVDISERMIGEARKQTDDPRIEYVQSAIEDFVIHRESFDCVVSRLALHYISDYEPLVKAVFHGLRVGGSFVISVEHPVCTATCDPWITDENGELSHWPVDRYGDEGERRQRWFVDGVVKYHRTVETYVGGILGAGFKLTGLLEPRPSLETLRTRPDLIGCVKRPAVLAVAATKM